MAELPTPPLGEIYKIDSVKGRALGRKFPVSDSQLPPKSVPVEEMNGWVAFPPDSWQEIERYIIQLRQGILRCE